MAAGFALYQSGIGWHSAMARSQGNLSSKANRTASLTSIVLCLFVPFRLTQKKAGTQQHDFAPKSYMRVCRLVIYMLALLLSWNTCCVGLVQQSLLPAKISGMLLGYHHLQSAYSFSMHAAAECYGAETWKIASRDFASLFQTPNSFTETRCALSVRKY